MNCRTCGHSMAMKREACTYYCDNRECPDYRGVGWRVSFIHKGDTKMTRYMVTAYVGPAWVKETAKRLQAEPGTEHIRLGVDARSSQEAKDWVAASFRAEGMFPPDHHDMTARIAEETK